MFFCLMLAHLASSDAIRYFNTGPPSSTAKDDVHSFAGAYIMMLFAKILFVSKTRDEVEVFMIPLLHDLR